MTKKDFTIGFYKKMEIIEDTGHKTLGDVYEVDNGLTKDDKIVITHVTGVKTVKLNLMTDPRTPLTCAARGCDGCPICEANQ